MKKYFALAVVMTLATLVYAQPSVQEGTRELSLEVQWDGDGPTGSLLDLAVGYGVFVRDGIEVGGLLGYTSVEDFGGPGSDWKEWAIGGFAEYHYDMASMTVPYIGARVYYDSYEVGSLDDTAFVYGPRLGIKHFLADNVAIDFALEYMLASEEIFVNDGEAEDSDLTFNIGIRAMF